MFVLLASAIRANDLITMLQLHSSNARNTTEAARRPSLAQSKDAVCLLYKLAISALI